MTAEHGKPIGPNARQTGGGMAALTTNQRPLPAGWRWVRLGDICRTTSGGTPSRGDRRFYGGGISWVKSGELNDGLVSSTEETISQAGLDASNAKVYPPGTLLIALYGATVGRLGILGISAATNQAVCAVFPDVNLHRDYLFFYMLGQRERLMEISFGGAQPNISQEIVRSLPVPLPPLPEQRRIAAILNEQMAAVERARAAAEAQLELLEALVESYLQRSLSCEGTSRISLAGCLREVTEGVGTAWSKYPVLGATRAGLAPAKEQVGKSPGRYKPVKAGTIFYNPMRILLGSIAYVDDGDTQGITSPDYVVFTTVSGIVHPRWFYYWLRSSRGAAFIKTLARGAVRERMLFRRLVAAELDVPPWRIQCETAELLAGIAGLRDPLSDQIGTINQLPAALLRQAFSGEL